MRRTAGHAGDFVRVYFRVLAAFESFPFVSGDLINSAAVWAGDKIPFPEAEQREEEKNKPLADAGDNCQGVCHTATGEEPAQPASQFPRMARNCEEKEHSATSLKFR